MNFRKQLKKSPQILDPAKPTPSKISAVVFRLFKLISHFPKMNVQNGTVYRPLDFFALFSFAR